LGEIRDKKKKTIANIVLDCHRIYKESMNGTYRRPKLESVPIPMQSREHLTSLNRKKNRQEMRN
jgi:hypothetical protein